MNDTCQKLLRFLYFAMIVGLLSGCGLSKQSTNMMQTPAELSGQKTAMMQQAMRQVTYQTEQATHGSFTVEMQNAYGAKQRAQFPLRRGMFVQDALWESGVLDQFQFLTVKLRRPTKDPMRYLPLEIEFNSEFRRVEPINDYAMHDGDYIIVKQTTGGEIDEMIDALRPQIGM